MANQNTMLTATQIPPYEQGLAGETQSLFSEQGATCRTPGPGANTSRSRYIHRVYRKGESLSMRLFFETWVPLSHCAICIILSVWLVTVLDGAWLKREEGHKTMDIFRGKRGIQASDVTTGVSAALVVLRTVGHCFMMGVAWRAAMVLLQHDGLTLSQLNTMITYRVPATWSGQHAWLIALALMILLPPTFISPLLSGSVDWVEGDGPGSNTSEVKAGFGLRQYKEADWDKVSRLPEARLGVLYCALGYAAQAWCGPDSTRYYWGWHRYVAWEEATINTIVYNVPMPFIELQISWDGKINDTTRQTLRQPSSLSHADLPFSEVVGNALFFKTQNTSFPTIPTEEPPSAISDTYKVAVLLSTDNQSDCSAITEPAWANGSWSHFERFSESESCWAVATVNLTVGIRYFGTGKYVGTRLVEADLGTNHTSQGDSWAQVTLYFLTDMMTMLPIVKKGDMSDDHTNITEYTEMLIRQSYLSTRAALHVFQPPEKHIKCVSNSTYIQAKVDCVRVWAWLILNLLLPASAFIMLWVERKSRESGKRRKPVFDTALAPLLTDVREVLAEDKNGISNMSYLTSSDTASVGKLTITPVDTGSGVVFALTKKRIQSSTHKVHGLGDAEGGQYTEDEDEDKQEALASGN